jgi:hypothetical protein
MGFIDRFRRPPNPTQAWRPDSRRPLTVDLDANTVCGVPLGARFDELSFLGPAHVDRHAPGTFQFRSVGLQVDTETIEGTEIDAFSVIVIAEGFYPGYDRFRGTIVYQGAPVREMSLRSEDAIVRTFGQPVNIDRHPEEIVLYYEFGEIGREIWLTSDERIRTVRLYRL